jgi:hypothetical protein
MSVEECKKILFKLGIEFGVSPGLISTRILSVQDKKDMMEGVLTIDALRASVEAAKASGAFKPRLSEGIKTGSQNRQTLRPEPEQPSCHYRRPFVCPDWRNDCHCRKGTTCHE